MTAKRVLYTIEHLHPYMHHNIHVTYNLCITAPFASHQRRSWESPRLEPHLAAANSSLSSINKRPCDPYASLVETISPSLSLFNLFLIAKYSVLPLEILRMNIIGLSQHPIIYSRAIESTSKRYLRRLLEWIHFLFSISSAFISEFLLSSIYTGLWVRAYTTLCSYSLLILQASLRTRYALLRFAPFCRRNYRLQLYIAVSELTTLAPTQVRSLRYPVRHYIKLRAQYILYSSAPQGKDIWWIWPRVVCELHVSSHNC